VRRRSRRRDAGGRREAKVCIGVRAGAAAGF
jgi:hypothetical protein